jgi:hypothetical protein
MNEILTGQEDPIFDEIERARLAAAQAPSSAVTVEEGIDTRSGDNVVRIETGPTTIQAANAFHGDTMNLVSDDDLHINKTRVESTTERKKPHGDLVHYESVITTHHYPDGDSFAHGRSTVRRRTPEGNETTRSSHDLGRARHLASLIARKAVAEAETSGKS